MKEYFINSLAVDDTAGAGLTESILNSLNQNGLMLNDCRGQGYDNGANMKGKNIGVQKKNSRSKFISFFRAMRMS